MKKFLTMVAIASLWPVFVCAQVPAWNEIKGEMKEALEAKGDKQRGEAAFDQCVGCHRKDASGRVSGAYPRLAGQHATVLIKQIADIRAGRRSNEKMEPFVDNHVLNAVGIADVASYLESLPIPAGNGKGSGTALERGKQLYDKDCADCHGAKGEGNAAKFYPMVAAQHYRYLLREIEQIRNGYRRNANPDMSNIIKPYTSADLEAVADYMSQFGAPSK
jgi:cytochrome c553